ncbi:MAG: response regulator transcription factor, partial [Oculatellaceae cyanobacterium Prado106]|nr:response regulator transcription factor [Oculatellaceae cyanobacterium Prado106]
MAKILLVCPDRYWAGGWKPLLVSQRFLVDISMNLQESLELLKLSQYDLILLDVPGRDRLHWYQRLRHSASQIPIQIPILLLLPSSEADLSRVNLNSGLDHYAIKPACIQDLTVKTVAGQELLNHLRSRLKHRPPVLLPILRWGQLELDPNLGQVTYGGRPVVLRMKEYQMLELFLRNRQRIFSNQNLMSTLWSNDKEPT